MIKYSKKKTIVNNETTVVLGKAEYILNVPKHIEEFVNKYDYIINAFNLILGKADGKGVAITQNGDTYDENIGKIIASTKAELTAKKKLWKHLCTLARYIDELSIKIDEDMDKLEKDFIGLSRNLHKLQSDEFTLTRETVDDDTYYVYRHNTIPNCTGAGKTIEEAWEDAHEAKEALEEYAGQTK